MSRHDETIKAISRLETQMENLSERMSKTETAHAKMVEDLNKVVNILSEARGGWKVLVMATGFAATFGAILGKIINIFISQ